MFDDSSEHRQFVEEAKANASSGQDDGPTVVVSSVQGKLNNGLTFLSAAPGGQEWTFLHLIEAFDPAPEPRRGGGAGEMGRTRLNPSVTLSWMTGLLKQETSS